MQSKISFCNLTVVKKDVTRFWPLWAVEVFLLQLGNGYLYFAVQNILHSKEQQFIYRKTVNAQAVLLQILIINTNVVLAAVFSIATAILVFGYLNRKQDCYAIHSMPLSRKTLFGSHFMAGLLMLIAPCVLSYLITGIISLVFGLGMGINILGMALEMLIIVIFFYSMACMVVMLSGNGTMSALIYGILNILVVGMSFMVTALASFISYGGGKTSIREVVKGAIHFTPLYYFSMVTDNATLRNIFDRLLGTRYGMSGIIVNDERIGELAKFPWKSLGACAIYLFPAVFFCIAAWFLYKKRRLEHTGDTMPFLWSKVIFRIVFSISGGMFFVMLLSLFVLQAVFDGLMYRIAFIVYMLLLIAGCAICYLISEMILAKEFKIWKKVSFVQMGIACAVMLFLLVFAKESYKEDGIVSAQDVKRVAVYFCGTTYYYEEGEVPKELEELQRKIVKAGAGERFYGDFSEEEYLDISFSYMTKDDREVYRYYTFFDYKNKEMLSEITDFFERQEEKEKKMFPESCNRETLCSYQFYAVDGEDEEEKSTNDDDVERVLEGVMEDIREGNMKIADWEQYQKRTANGKILYLSFDLDIGVVDQELCLDERCVHTLKALEATGN